MSRFACLLPVLSLLLWFAPTPAMAQYEQMQEDLRKAWAQVAPTKSGQVVPVDYAVANGMFAKAGQAMSGKGMLLAGGKRATYTLQEGARTYEIFQKGPAIAFRAGKAEFLRASPKQRAQHTAMLSYIPPGELVVLLMQSVSRIRRAGTQRVFGVTCLVYSVTYSEHNVGPLFRRLGQNADLADSSKKSHRPRLSATFFVEKKTGRLRQVQANFRIRVKKPAEKKKRNFSWEGAGGGMGVVIEKDGKVLNAPKRKPTEYRTYSLKTTFHSPRPTEQELEIPQRARKLLGW